MRFLESIQLTWKRGDTILNGSQSSLVAIFYSGGWCVLHKSYCFAFAKMSCSYETPVNSAFNDWKNVVHVGAKRGDLTNHELFKTHQSTMVAAENFLKISRGEESIKKFLSNAYSA